MDKEIAIILEDESDIQAIEYCKKIIDEYSAAVTLVINPRADINRCDAAIFIFAADCSDTNAKMCAWVGHPHLRAVWGGGKNEMLKREILHIAGIPRPYEIERKFLIEMPDADALENMPNCRRVSIEQMYLKEENGVRARIRRRNADGRSIYFLTEKKFISAMKRIETEREITQGEYESLSLRAEDGYAAIEKSRYCLMYGGKYFEIDVFPFWEDKAYAEIELCSEDEQFALPPFVRVIKEVTDDKSYTNRALAKRLGTQQQDF